MVIGKLNVRLGLNSQSFNTGMRSSSRRIRTLNDQVQATSSFLPKLQNAIKGTAVAITGLGVAAAGATYAGIRILRTEMERLDKIGKTAQKLGMLPESLVGLQHAASLAGIEQNKLDMAVQRMTRRVAEAAKGTGEAQGALAELRLDAERLASATPDVALMQVADAMARVESQSDRVRLAFKLFDAEGVDLVRMMEGGSQAIRQAMQDAEELGLTFSRIDHAKVAMANDAMMRLEQSTGMLKLVMATELAPAITVIADTMTEWLTDTNAKTREAAGGFSGIVTAGAGIIDMLREIQIHWTATQALVVRGFKAITDGLAKLPWGVRRLMIPLAFDVPSDEMLAEVSSGLQAEFNNLNNTVNNLQSQDWGQSFLDRIQDTKDKIREGLEGPAASGGLADLDALNEQSRRMQEIQRRAESMTQALRTPFEVLQDRIIDANKLLDLGAISWQTYQREVAAARKEFERLQSLSSGPKLMEEGTQEFYAAMDRWNAMGQQGPQPDADLVRDRSPQEEAVFAGGGRLPTSDPFMPTLPEMPRLELGIQEPTLPRNMDIGGPPANQIVQVVPVPVSQVAQIPQLGRKEERGQPKPTRPEGAKDNREMLATLRRMDAKLGKIATETGRTTAASKRTASAVEQLEMPESMEM